MNNNENNRSFRPDDNRMIHDVDFVLINPDDKEYKEHTRREANESFFRTSGFDSSKNRKSGRGKSIFGRKRTRKRIAAALCCVMIGGASGFGGAMIAEHTGAVTLLESSGANRTVTVKKVSSSEKMSASEVYAANVDATVGISTKSTSRNMFGYTTESAASGSGFIVSTSGYIVTNYHVIEGADSVTVTLNNGSSYDATIRGYNESKDIAVLKINASGLKAVTLGSSDDANVGDEVITIGNPLGELTFSLTSGAISALNREVTFSQGSTMKLIQTDAAINSGNSGGALFNMYGEVIGITNAKYSSSSSSEASIDNIGFAIPIDDVEDIIQDIIKNGTKTNASSSYTSDSASGNGSSEYYGNQRQGRQGYQ